MVTKHFGLKQHFLLRSIYATLRNTTVMTRDLQLSSQRDTVMHTNRAKLLPVHEGVFPNSANGIVSSSYLTELAWSWGFRHSNGTSTLCCFSRLSLSDRFPVKQDAKSFASFKLLFCACSLLPAFAPPTIDPCQNLIRRQFFHLENVLDQTWKHLFF